MGTSIRRVEASAARFSLFSSRGSTSNRRIGVGADRTPLAVAVRWSPAMGERVDPRHFHFTVYIFSLRYAT